MSLFAALLFGIVAGLRVLTAEAVFFGLRATGVARVVFPVCAAGEYVVDVLPLTPARTRAGSLVLRLASGAFMGHVAAGLPGLALGIIGALAGTYGGYLVRTAGIAKIGNVPSGIIEDIVAIGLAFAAVTLL
jgi:uncharacterized membrane protein